MPPLPDQIQQRPGHPPMAGGVLGTPDYMSPEQAKGEDVDRRSDLFSLGCILFECAVGEKPFRSPSLTGVLLSIINDEPFFRLNWRSLGLPTALRPILHHALEKDRDKRFPTGSELIAALTSLPPDAVETADALVRNEVPVTEEPKAEEPKAEGPKAEGPKAEGPKAEEPKAEEPKAEGPKAEGPKAEGPQEEEPMAASGAPGSVDEGSGVAHGVTSRAASDRSGAAQQLEPVSAERLQSLKDESRPLRLSPTLSEHLQNVEISPEEGFLLSRIDGSSRAREILSLSPMPEPDSAGALIELLNKGLIYWGGSANSNVVRKKAQPTEKAKPNGALDAQVLAELDRLLRLAEEGDFAALLGLEPGAPESARKSSYRKLIGKFHPDKFARSDDVIHAKLSRLCAAASEGLTELAKPPEQRSLSQAASEGKGNDSDSGFDKQSYGRELYDRGLRAFDSHDFWDAIQLARQAIEVDDQQAEFFALLGRSLMQNKKWRKEAADSFHRASELDPDNVEFLGMLGAIYQAVGLATRAQTILEKAQAIDPAYELPELEPEPTFSD